MRLAADLKNAPFRAHYWIKLAYKTGALEDGTHFRAIGENEVSVTPMHLDFT